MSSFGHGLSGLMLAYTLVEGPLAMTLIRRGVELRRVITSAAAAAPLTVLAGLGQLAMSPLVQGLGVSAGSFIEFAVGVGTYAGVGYTAARLIARPPVPESVHRRGTIIEDPTVSFAPDRRPDPPRPSGQARYQSFSRDASGSRAFAANGPTVSRARSAPTVDAGSSPASDVHTPPAFGGRSAGSQGRSPAEPGITLAGLPVTTLDETKHFKLIGTTGTGKSTAIRELLTGALRRGDRAIIADPDGGYMARFKDSARGDLVLNPFTPESRKWDLFGEITNPYDIDQLARSLLPDPGGPDRSWIGYARTFFTAVTRQAHEAGVTDMRELYNLLVIADVHELRSFLAGTPAQPFLEEHNGRMFDSIRSVTSSAVASLDYIAQQTTQPLSIRQWVASTTRRAPATDRAGEESRGGVLFIPYKAGQIAALRSTISAWMRLAIFESMSQPEGDQRLWFVVDELDALGQIDGLKDALARLRKFGGRCVLGFQSIAQVSNTYGRGEAQTIVENCGNTLLLRCSGSEPGGTAHFASHLIGHREVLRTQRSRSRGPDDFRYSTTLSEHIGIEPAVMDSQIEQLPDLAGYLKFASQPSWQRVNLIAPDHLASAKARTGSRSEPRDDHIDTRTEARSFWRKWRANVFAAATGRSPAGPHLRPKQPASDRTARAPRVPQRARDGMDYD